MNKPKTRTVRDGRRRSIRGQVISGVQKPTGRRNPMTVLDLSDRGARILVTVPLSAGDEVTMVFDKPYCKAPLRCAGKVIWSIEVTRERFAAGVRLYHPINGNEMRWLSIS